MSVPESLKNLVGHWSGKNRLWLSPQNPVRESESTASVTLAARGRFMSIAYTWAFEGAAQEGLLLLGYDGCSGAVKAVWIDSWHMSDKFMHCAGGEIEGGAVSVRGSYSAPPGPDWGWRTVIQPVDGESFHFIMYNIAPDGGEEFAVEAAYSRSR